MTFRLIAWSVAIAITTPCASYAQAAHNSAQHKHTPAATAPAGTDAEQIREVMKKQFDQPDAPLIVEPVTAQGNNAVAGWTQGAKGGRALLRKDKGRWTIAVCAGDGLTRTEVSHLAGLSRAAADTLSRAVLSAESHLSTEKKALFSSFEGMVKIDSAAAHGQHGALDKP